jgi:uncharacterized membrane protein YfcA
MGAGPAAAAGLSVGGNIEVSLFLFVLAGACLGGFVSGLAGFGTGLVALGLWLHVVEPALAAPLVVICSVVAQLQSLFVVRRAMNWARLWPFIAGGLLGVPLGVAALDQVPAETFRAALGAFLVIYSAAMLLSGRLPVVAWGGRAGDAVIGFGGGILGGAAGLSGPLPTLWCGLKGWTKNEQRAVFQTFNLSILGWALIAYGVQGVLTAEVGKLALICLPGTFFGVWLGMKTYGRVDDRQFRRIVLWLLLVSGSLLVASHLG